MPFPSKLTAEYVELINNELDKIPINNIEDFSFIVTALNSIPRPDNNTLRSPTGLFYTYNTPHPLNEAIAGVIEILNNPDSYVQDKNNYDEFQILIYSRITQKISEFQNMSLIEKQEYIQNQQSMRLEAETSSRQAAAIAQARQRQPQPFEHTTGAQETEEEFLARRQREFQNEIIASERQTPTPMSVIMSFVRETGIPFIQLASIELPIVAELINSRNSVSILMQNNLVTLEELVHLNSIQRQSLLSNPQSPESRIILTYLEKVRDFIRITNISSTRFFAINRLIRTEIIENALQIAFIMTNTSLPLEIASLMIIAQAPLEQLLTLSPSRFQEVINNWERILCLTREANVSFSQLFNILQSTRSETVVNNFIYCTTQAEITSIPLNGNILSSTIEHNVAYRYR